MKSAGFFLAVLLAFSDAGWAQSNTVYNFLRSDVSARAAALAGSFFTVTNDPNLLFYNPAGIGTLEQPTGSVGFFKHLLDINSGYVSYGQAFEGIGHFGVGVLYTNYGSFTETDDQDNTLGTFSAADIAASVAYSNTLDENLFYGVALKFIHSSIADAHSAGLATDVGILYRVPDTRLNIGASVRNLGGQLSAYVNTKEELPLDVAFGASIVPKGLPLLLNVNFHKLNESADNFADRFRSFTVGGEFTLSKVIQLRFGYNNEQRKDLRIESTSGLAGFSAGLGLVISEYRFDYALSSLGKIGSLHRISIGTNF
ncbi:MAG: hypothetical protein H6Q30_1265 [Bacteroidetes bacterium]|nr:hypothetical protein [Bacteroidota bacterium]